MAADADATAPPLAVISWPFEHGLPDRGMGAGAALLAGDPDLHALLEGAGWAPTLQRVAGGDAGAPELARTFDVLRQLARDVRSAVTRGAFPLVLAGGCLSAAATVAGAGDTDLGVVWLDAHADLDDPEDNESGFLDVMALSVLTGRCWRAQRERIDGHVPVPEERVALLGVRDLAAYQRARMEASGVHVVPGAIEPVARDRALAALPARTYLHVDLDVLDPSVGRANAYAAPCGASLDAVLRIVDRVFDRGPVVAAALSAYDPAVDRDGAILDAARAIAGRIAVHAMAQRR
ncbi:MAG TPA: arginase family protein [Baekduia sp.]|nr:arginase family protein [Baekduia sp.]